MLFIILFFFPLFLGWKRKGEKNNQSRDFKSCFFARFAIVGREIAIEKAIKKKGRTDTKNKAKAIKNDNFKGGNIKKP